MDKIVDYTIKMIRYALSGDVPERPGNIDFEKLYIFSSRHGVENMLYSSMRQLKIKLPVRIAARFKNAYEMQIMLEATQDMELRALGREFDKAGIDYIPLKGSVVKELYPVPDYRKSSDIDILIHPGDESKLRPIARSFGYELSREDNDSVSQIEYTRLPYMVLEVHRSLLNGDHRANRFCEKVWDYAICKGRRRYELDANYLYVYLIAHIAKHLVDGGAGVKMITDLWLLKRTGELDRHKVEQLLELADLAEIESYIDKIVGVWYEGKEYQDRLVMTLEKFFISLGSIEKTARNIDKVDLGGAPAEDIAALYEVVRSK